MSKEEGIDIKQLRKKCYYEEIKLFNWFWCLSACDSLDELF